MLRVVKPKGVLDTRERPHSFKMADLNFQGSHYIPPHTQFWQRVHRLPRWLQRIIRYGGDPFFKAQLIYGPFRLRKLRYVRWGVVTVRQFNRGLAALWGIRETLTVTEVSLRYKALPQLTRLVT